MKPTLSDHDLLAYADGELPEDRREAIRRALADQPHLTARVEELIALRQSARRAVHNATPEAPQSLRQKLAGLDATDDAPLSLHPAPAPPPAAGKSWRWRIAAPAVAAVLIAAAAGWLYVLSINAKLGTHPPAEPAIFTMAAFVNDVTRKHLMCSALEDHFIDPQFPRSVKDLGQAAESFMGQPVLTPDLTSIGFEFAGAGPCNVPGGQTLHILYRSTRTGEFISLFVQRPPWKIEVDDGHQAIGAGPDADHPMIIWRADTVMYYLVCDDFGACEQAQKLIDQQLQG